MYEKRSYYVYIQHRIAYEIMQYNVVFQMNDLSHSCWRVYHVVLCFKGFNGHLIFFFFLSIYFNNKAKKYV